MAALPGITPTSLTLHVPRERIRLIVAITLSALLHLWFAGGVAVREPRHVPARSPAIISVRLEMPVTPPAVPPPLQDEVHPAHERGADELRRARPADTGARNSKPSPHPAFVEQPPDARAPAAALPAVADPLYYPASQLDAYPALIQPVNLDSLRHAAHGNISGRVLLMLLIDESGGVREVSVIEPGPAASFEHALRAAFLEARFFPARKDGRAVKSRVLISVDYQEFAGLGPDKLLK